MMEKNPESHYEESAAVAEMEETWEEKPNLEEPENWTDRSYSGLSFSSSPKEKKTLGMPSFPPVVCPECGVLMESAPTALVREIRHPFTENRIDSSKRCSYRGKKFSPPMVFVEVLEN